MTVSEQFVQTAASRGWDETTQLQIVLAFLDDTPAMAVGFTEFVRSIVAEELRLLAADAPAADAPATDDPAVFFGQDLDKALTDRLVAMEPALMQQGLDAMQWRVQLPREIWATVTGYLAMETQADGAEPAGGLLLGWSVPLGFDVTAYIAVVNSPHGPYVDAWLVCPEATAPVSLPPQRDLSVALDFRTVSTTLHVVQLEELPA